MSNNQFLYVGSYTRKEQHLVSANGQGIYQYNLDLNSGILSFVSLAVELTNPSYLCLDQKTSRLYAVSEVTEQEATRGAGVTSYSINPDGSLTTLNSQSANGGGACYISHDSSNHQLLLANYTSGSIAIYPLNTRGKILPASFVKQYVGQDRNHNPPKAAHCHCIVVAPNNNFLLVADLGTDNIYRYQLCDQQSPTLISTTQMPAGSGPRHLIFHPNQQHLLVISELNNQVSLLSYQTETSDLEIIQHISTLPDSYEDTSWAGDIQMTPNGKFIYASNRGHNSIVIYEFKESEQQLELIGFESTAGEFPRSFVIDDTGSYLLVANQNSDSIVSFRINSERGTLSKISEISAPTPVCLKLKNN